MKYNIRLLIEAVVVGFVCLVIGVITHIIIMNSLKYLKIKMNDHYVYYISTFISGIIVHILFDLFGGNKWYCKHGIACQEA